jgi:hypothetical protein
MHIWLWRRVKGSAAIRMSLWDRNAANLNNLRIGSKEIELNRLMISEIRFTSSNPSDKYINARVAA